MKLCKILAFFLQIWTHFSFFFHWLPIQSVFSVPGCGSTWWNSHYYWMNMSKSKQCPGKLAERLIVGTANFRYHGLTDFSVLWGVTDHMVTFCLNRLAIHSRVIFGIKMEYKQKLSLSKSTTSSIIRFKGFMWSKHLNRSHFFQDMCM